MQSCAAPLLALQSVKLLGRLRECTRLMHDSLCTLETDVHCCRASIGSHGLRHCTYMGKKEEAFLTHLALDRPAAVFTHRQALSALLFLYGKVLGTELP